MTEEILQFLRRKDVQDLLAEGDYAGLYRTFANSKIYFNLTGKFTDLLYAAGIDPLSDLDYIPRHFLHGSTITSFQIPHHVRVIGSEAFTHCLSLKVISIPEQIKVIPERAFEGCTSLTEAHLKGVVRIGWLAFSDCSSLKVLNLPNTLREIELGAFCQCDSLKEITYSGAAGEWLRVKKAEAFGSYHKGLIIHCTNGDVQFQGGGRWKKV